MLSSFLATIQARGLEFKNQFGNEKGATAVEYGIMVALIAVVIIVAVTAVGTNLSTLFNTVSGNI